MPAAWKNETLRDWLHRQRNGLLYWMLRDLAYIVFWFGLLGLAVFAAYYPDRPPSFGGDKHPCLDSPHLGSMGRPAAP